MSDDQFTKLFAYLRQEFGAVRSEISDLRSEMHGHLNSMYGLLDVVIRQNETIHQDQMLMNKQLVQHDKWIHQIARKTDAKLFGE